MLGKRQSSIKEPRGTLAPMEAMAADFHNHAARIRSMADGRAPEIQARLQIIAKTFDDRGNTLLKRQGS